MPSAQPSSRRAGARRAGEAHHVDVRMRGERFADARPVAIDQIEHARRHAGLVQDFGEQHGVSGASSDGFSTIVQPAASAGPTLAQTWFIGQFHGVIMPTTPIGSRTMCGRCHSRLRNWKVSSCLRASIR